MFEEICLVCGKHLDDDRQAYCSDDCQQIDLSSPSISSSSSALSSPYIDCAVGGEVPALVPSALGTALQLYAKQSSQRVSSSSASSNTAWSTSTDEDEDSSHPIRMTEDAFQEAQEFIHDTASKSGNYIYSINPSGLSYARRPSGTNNHSTVPQLHRRLSSGSSLIGKRGLPRSAPISSLVDEDDTLAQEGYSSWDPLLSDESELFSEKDSEIDIIPKYPTATKVKRTRNRASLPACFSLLQTSSPSKRFRTSPVSSSSANTIARPSPPTPKLPLSNAFSQVQNFPVANSTPRGRQREADKSKSSRRSGSSHSRPAPFGSSSPQLIDPRAIHSRAQNRNNEDEFDWDAAAHLFPRRGRETMKRNSSPPPIMLMGVEDPNRAVSVRRARGERSHSGNSSRPRGRARVEDLGIPTGAPGLGYGRSGLIDRERGAGGHISRVPL